VKLSAKRDSQFSRWILAACLAVGTAAFPHRLLAIQPESPAVSPPPAPSVCVPDAKRLDALGMIETGNHDDEVGGAGEISRYQIHPAVWRSYSTSLDYANPEVALQVASRHWTCLANYFKAKTGREPDDFDMYVLWNTRFGYYARKGFSRARISPVVQDRAERFVNLVNRKA
jgi:hypothetical protein